MAFPFPPHGRIPNFKGAKDAALVLFNEPEWRDAKLIWVNPDLPQKYVRAAPASRAQGVRADTTPEGGVPERQIRKIPYGRIQ